jgi:O-antigen ligase
VYLWTGSSIRLFQGRVFWELLQEEKKYFFGYGFNSSQEQIKAKHIQYNLYPGFHNYNFHNQYLQTMAELGIIGLLSLGFILINFLKIPFKSRSLFPILIAVVFLILFLTESYLVRQRGIVYFLFYYCLIIKYAQQR